MDIYNRSNHFIEQIKNFTEDPSEKNMMIFMYNILEQVYRKICTRREGLSFFYIAYKISEILNIKNCKIKKPYLHTNILKMKNSDKIWRKICMDLEWKFIPSV